MLYIDPDECIDCDACVEACPVDACFAEDQLPAEWAKYTEINADYYKSKAAASRTGAPALACPRQASGYWTTGSSVPPMGGASAAAGSCLQDRQLLRRGGDDAAGGLADRLRGRGVGFVGGQRRAGVGVLAQRLGERDLAEQGHIELVGEELAAALAEDREALAARGREAGHVLDHAQQLEVDFLSHLGAAAGDRLRSGLRRGDDQDLGLGEQLGEGHGDVAGARREVEQQVVELAPGDVLEELLDRLVEHRPAPDDRGVLLDEEADRHHLDPGRRRRAEGSCAPR